MHTHAHMLTYDDVSRSKCGLLHCCKESASGSERKDFIHEIDTMKKVAEGKNPHVVNMVGCVTIQEPLCLITEFVKHGDLLSYLKSMRKMVETDRESV